MSAFTYFANFNPSYNIEDVKRMKYIQAKYLIAYGKESSLPTQMLLSSNIPATPFANQEQFDESLSLNYDSFSGNVNEFSVSHALRCIEAINEYQEVRKNRVYIPLVSSPGGHANDYISMFLNETKQWIITKMTSLGLTYEELCKRDEFYENLKNDRYRWCFPDEIEANHNSITIRKVIEIIHERVKDIKEAMFRIERNKSLSNELDQLNCLTRNAFEYGKKFLACLLMRTKLYTSNFDGNARDTSYEAGKLHKLLDYVISPTSYSVLKNVEDVSEQICWYISVDEVAHNNFFFFGINYDIHVWYPDGSSFNVRKKFSDFQTLHSKLPSEQKELLALPSEEHSPHSGMHERLQNYLRNLCSISTKAQYKLIREFFNVAFIEVNSSDLPEYKSNLFLSLKQEYNNYLEECMIHPPTTTTNSYEFKYVSKALIDFHNVWGKDIVLEVFGAYAILQRMYSVHQWIQEINLSLVSMIGGMLAFSEIPLNDILIIQNDLMNSFDNIGDKLYDMTVEKNEMNQYAWHKNLFNANELKKKFKSNKKKCISSISVIIDQHLGKNALHRLNEVRNEFRNLLQRVQTNLHLIREELSLQKSTLKIYSNGNEAATLLSSSQGDDDNGDMDIEGHPTACYQENKMNNISRSLNHERSGSSRSTASSTLHRTMIMSDKFQGKVDKNDVLLIKLSDLKIKNINNLGLICHGLSVASLQHCSERPSTSFRAYSSITTESLRSRASRNGMYELYPQQSSSSTSIMKVKRKNATCNVNKVSKKRKL